MENVRITDLDELVLIVRDRGSRSYILEAINAYRGGAYRAAVIATWIAVTFDIIAKTRELAGQGDAAAITFVSSLDNAISAQNRQKLQTLENDLLKMAQEKFEFLSSHEYEDLFRLMRDRNLCAHPAFVNEDALFQPTPELVRTHIVHSVLHLLQHQPIQGKSVIKRITDDLIGNLFTYSESTSFIEYLKERYLKRAKKSLIQNLVDILLKDMLSEKPNSKPWRSKSALSAIEAVNIEIYEARIREKVPILISDLPEKDVHHVFKLLSFEERIWNWLPDHERLRIKSTLSSMDIDTQPDIVYAFECSENLELREALVAALKAQDFDFQLILIREFPKPMYIDVLIKLFSEVNNFRKAEKIGETLVDVSNHLTAEQVTQILQSSQINDQIYFANAMPKLLSNLFEVTRDSLYQTGSAWKSFIEARINATRSTTSSSSFPEVRQKLLDAGIAVVIGPIDTEE